MRQQEGNTGGPSLRDIRALLPSPAASDWRGQDMPGRQSPSLREVGALLPTPVVTDSFGSRRSTARTDEWTSNPGTTLTDAIWETLERTTDTIGNPLPGASTHPPSHDGSGSSDAEPHTQLTIEDA